MTPYGANIQHLYAYRKHPHAHCGVCHAPAPSPPLPTCAYCGTRNWYDRYEEAGTLRDPHQMAIRQMIVRHLSLLQRQGWDDALVVHHLLGGSCFPDPHTGYLRIYFVTACSVLIDAEMGDALDTYKRKFPTAWQRSSEGRGIYVESH